MKIHRATAFEIALNNLTEMVDNGTATDAQETAWLAAYQEFQGYRVGDVPADVEARLLASLEAL